MRIVRLTTALCFASLLMFPACRTNQHQQAAPAPATIEPAAMPLDVGVTLPLDLQMEIVQASPNGLTQIRTTFSFKLEQARVKIEIVLPEKTTLANGAMVWEGELKRGQGGELSFGVRSQDMKPRFVIARATVTQPDGRTFTQATSAYLDAGQKLAKASQSREVQGYQGAERIQVHRPQAEN